MRTNLQFRISLDFDGYEKDTNYYQDLLNTAICDYNCNNL
jgi:hypothetical protein